MPINHPGTELSEDIPARLRQLYDAAVAAASPKQAVEKALQADAAARPLHIFALGKAAPEMFAAAADYSAAIGGECRSAIIVTNQRGEPRPAEPGAKEATIIYGGHPLPNAQSLEAGKRLCQAAEQLGENDFGLVLISGGGSAMAEVAGGGLGLDDIIDINRKLLACGADISETNTVRRGLSAFKGGGWASHFRGPWRCLIISDVIGDNLADIASGPMVKNPTTNEDARLVLEKYNLAVGEAVRKRLQQSPPTYPVRRQSGACEIIASNVLSVRGMVNYAAANNLPIGSAGGSAVGGAGGGGEPLLARGEAREFAVEIAAKAATLARPSMLFGGGETTVTIRGHGKGGRNQELALAYCLEAEKRGLATPWHFLSAGTDGIDGPTDAAGAIVGDDTLGKIREAGIDPQRMLDDNDSYNALNAANCLLKPGASGTNVADIQALYLG